MTTFGSDFYADLHDSRGGYIVASFAEQVEQRRRDQALSKAALHGEGSRGGHIIGHTKSGKPVYGTSSGHRIPQANHPHYKGLRLGIGHETAEARSGARGTHIDRHFGFFSAKDHDQAAEHHKSMAKESKSHITRARHSAAADGHETAAMMIRAGYVPHQVIGYTHSRKPITASSGLRGDEVYSGEHIVRMANLGFSQRDHEDAASVHRFHRDAAKNPIIRQLHHNAMVSHESAAKAKDFSTGFSSRTATGQELEKNQSTASLTELGDLRKTSRKGEGSHGGHIIGHTRSGKPIYAAGVHAESRGMSVATVGFTPDDHTDAMKAHFDHAAFMRAKGDKSGARLADRAADEHEDLRNLQRTNPSMTPQEHAAQAKLHDKAGMRLLMAGAKAQSSDFDKGQSLKAEGAKHLDRAVLHAHLAQASSSPGRNAEL